MKLRSTFLALAALLLLSSLASAAALSTPADSASANLSAIFTAPASPDGAANAQLPSFAPSPIDKSLFSTCGSCSETVCVGKTVGTICRIQGGATFTCQHAYVICTAKDCECWTGPLP